MSAWFTVRLDDRPGSLARAAQALADRGVNITGIVGVAEDTDGELMLTTSDAGRDARGADRSRRRLRRARPDGPPRPGLARLAGRHGAHPRRPLSRRGDREHTRDGKPMSFRS